MNDSPHTSLEHRSTDEEFCHYTIRVLNHTSGKSCCMPCFVNLETTSDPSKFDLLIEHHLVKGLPAPYYCEHCNKNLTESQLIKFCRTCLNKCSKLLISFYCQKIDVRQINFRFDVLNDRMISLKRKINDCE